MSDLGSTPATQPDSNSTVSQPSFAWTDFYKEFADNLLAFRHDRSTLIQHIRNVYSALQIKLPTIDSYNDIKDIDPFTVFGLFNRDISTEERIKILKEFKLEFGIKAPVPTSFEGLIILRDRDAVFGQPHALGYAYDIENLWKVFQLGLEYAGSKFGIGKEILISTYDSALNQPNVSSNLSIGLYYARPFDFIGLDQINRSFIVNPEFFDQQLLSKLNEIDFNYCTKGEAYLQIIDELQGHFQKPKNSAHLKIRSFPELSYQARLNATNITTAQESELSKDQPDQFEFDEPWLESAFGSSNSNSKKYWLYSPGESAEFWEEFLEDEIMAIGWDELGDLSQYENKNAIKQKVEDLKLFPQSKEYISYVTWCFCNEIHQGDIIFAKRGKNLIVGRGIVQSDYRFDPNRDNFKHVRNVKWTDDFNLHYPHNRIGTLFNITSRQDLIDKINDFLAEQGTATTIAHSNMLDVKYSKQDVSVTDVSLEAGTLLYPAYTKVDFLNEVFMSEDDYDELVQLLDHKQNIILQGAPGVGKTFAAKRLAYSILGEQNPDRVNMVQFHQSYSYEDFIQGFRPTDTGGFELKAGAFYNFCKAAEQDADHKYFFIIDEINRGNMSKILGELFMLIETDKRDTSIQLLYSAECFSVPKNVYIIGLMNTADRSLALLDFALRRRFAFFDLKPAFQSAGFIKYRQSKHNKSFNKMIPLIEELNADIKKDGSLGPDFLIGHSFFCTDGEVTNSWLRRIINHEIIPLLREYWFDNAEKFNEWRTKLLKDLDDEQAQR